MFRTKFTVRRMDDFRVVARDKKRRIYLFKIKRTLPEQKIVNITKTDQSWKLSMEEENLNILMKEIQ